MSLSVLTRYQAKPDRIGEGALSVPGTTDTSSPLRAAVSSTVAAVGDRTPLSVRGCGSCRRARSGTDCHKRVRGFPDRGVVGLPKGWPQELRELAPRPVSRSSGPLLSPAFIIRLEHSPIMSKVLFVTGAGCGLGADIARQVLSAGHQVVATSRRPERVAEVLGGEQDNLLAAALDITDPGAAETAVDRFGRIDALINNAADFSAGFSEEHVTRAVLPVMRKQRSGHVITISSLATWRRWSASASASPTRRPSSASRASWSPCATTSSRSASAPRSSSRASSAPGCWTTPPPPGRSCPSTTTSSAPPPR